MKYLIAFFVMCVGLVGCIPEPHDLTLEEAETKLVISSQVIPNQVMIVTVSKSFGALSFSNEEDSVTQELLDQLLVTGARVTIAYNGVTDTLWSVSGVPGVYVSVNTPQYLNTQYHLEVHDPATGLSVTSDAEMLERAFLDTIYADTGVVADVPYVDMTVKFQDLVGDNWYMVNIYSNENDALQQGSPFTLSDDIATETVLISDKEFSTSQIETTTRLFDWTNDTMYVSLSNISQEYYDYLNLRKKGENFFTSVVKEPISYPSNVNGGYGYFTTHYPNTRIWIRP